MSDPSERSSPDGLDSLPDSPAVEDTEVAAAFADAAAAPDEVGLGAVSLDDLDDLEDLEGEVGSPTAAQEVEDLIDQLESVVTERDQFLALAQAKQAELENFRKVMMKRQADQLQQANAGLVEKLLPVLDAFDAALSHGVEELRPMLAQLLDVLDREGLSRVGSEGAAFDPTEHEAVAHEPGDDAGDGPVVAETLRAGWRYNGRLLRPAMVRARG